MNNRDRNGGQRNGFSNGNSEHSGSSNGHFGGNRFSNSGGFNQSGGRYQSNPRWQNRDGGSSNGGHRQSRFSEKPIVPPAEIVVNKDFYIESKSGPKNPREVEEYYSKEQITVVGENVPHPMSSFADYPWPQKIADSFRTNGYAKPTPIQAQGWPIALSGKDLVGIAQTGSGKTLAYILPAFIHIEGQPIERRDNGPMALVLAPTRELAQQIQDVVRQCNNYCRSVCVFGGASKHNQTKEIYRTNPQLIIATPGRLIDFLESGVISVANVSYLVLDEADRMLDMGFEPQIRKIISRTPSNDRQTLMWSATWPKEVRALACDFLVDYIQINIGSLSLHANHNITQIVDICGENEKKEKLFRLMQEILTETKENKTIIFAETKRKVDEIAKQLRGDGWPANCIHGDKSQQERDWTLKEFKSGRAPILVATDVAARGLGLLTNCTDFLGTVFQPISLCPVTLVKFAKHRCVSEGKVPIPV